MTCSVAQAFASAAVANVTMDIARIELRAGWNRDWSGNEESCEAHLATTLHRQTSR